MAEQEQPHPIDIHVGGRIRLRRKFRGTTQEQLAKALGLTFQQVQKYERGANRVSASKLYEIATALSVEIAYLFEGLPNPAEGGQGNLSVEIEAQRFLATDEGAELALLFPSIADGKIRRQILSLVRTLAGADEQ